VLPVSGAFSELGRTIESLRRVAAGETVQSFADALRARALELAAQGWDAKESPRGVPWRPAKGGLAGDLSLTGRLRAALRVEPRAGGFAITDRAQAASGQFYGGTHQYGRTMRARGLKPMRWRTPDGRWHSAWKVRVPARPILPRSGELPARWAQAFEQLLRLLNSQQAGRPWERTQSRSLSVLSDGAVARRLIGRTQRCGTRAPGFQQHRLERSRRRPDGDSERYQEFEPRHLLRSRSPVPSPPRPQNRRRERTGAMPVNPSPSRRAR